jgi:hypothetical protein
VYQNRQSGGEFMSVRLPSPSANSFRLTPVEHRHAALSCFALLTISCVLASFSLACATPFAAFAVIAAAMLPLRSAILVVAGAWLVNQGIGFGALHYPIDANTMLWGLVIGLATLAATAISVAVLRLLAQGRTLLVLALVLACSYGAYELVLLAATPILGGVGAFTAAIIARIELLNMVWLIGLVAVCEIVRRSIPSSAGMRSHSF